MKPTLSLFALSLLFALPAHAQKPAPQPPPGVSSQLQDILGGTLKPSAKKTAAVSTKFVSTGKLLFVDEIMTKMTLDDAQKEAFRKYATQVIGLTETAYRENGYEKNDLGVALGGLLEICYELDQGTFVLGETDKEKLKEDKKKTAAAVRQLQYALGSAPAFPKIPDRARQLAYEACAFTTGHLAVTWQQAGRDEAKQSAARKMAREQIQSLFRFDPDGITRNAAGEFVAKKKADGEQDARDKARDKSGTETGKDTSEPPVKAPAPEEIPAPSPPETPVAETGGEPQSSVFVPAPDGWKTERFKGGIVLYTPRNARPEEEVSVAVFPRRLLQGQEIEAWMQTAIQNDPVRPGKLAAPPTIKAASGNVVSGTCLYTRPDGKQVIGIYTGFTLDKETIRLIRTVAPSDALTRNTDTIGKITGAVIQADKKAAVASGRGLDIEKLPPTPDGMKPGGALQEGIYAGNRLYGNEVRDRSRLYLYKNGQYRMYNKTGEQTNSSVRLGYTYDPRSGKLNLENGMQDDMTNDRFDPEESYCLYGRDAAGKPYLYTYSNRGFSAATARQEYVGPVDRPAPQQEADAKAQAEAEAKRYKWVVPAGQGLKNAQIAGIVLNQQLHQFYNGSGLSVSSTYDLYLLLNDGTVYNGLPVPPDELDAARSRRQEPEKWGRWRKEGKTYLAAWPDAPNQFKPLKGGLASPAEAGMRLAGRYGAGETSGSLLGGSYRLWGVTFTPEGRFRKDNRGGYGTSTLSQNSGMASINSAYDEKGSYTSATGENFVVASGKKNSPNGNLTGTYSLNGYVLTLRDDNGRVTRWPFFFVDGTHEAVWFEGAVLGKDSPKK